MILSTPRRAALSLQPHFSPLGFSPGFGSGFLCGFCRQQLRMWELHVQHSLLLAALGSAPCLSGEAENKPNPKYLARGSCFSSPAPLSAWISPASPIQGRLWSRGLDASPPSRAALGEVRQRCF